VSLVTDESNGARNVTQERNGPLSKAERQRLYRQRQREKRQGTTQNAAGAAGPQPSTKPRTAPKTEKATRYQEMKAQADQAAREPAKRKPGAPTMCSEALGQEICERIAAKRAPHQNL
jgi:hypothetical protein